MSEVMCDGGLDKQVEHTRRASMEGMFTAESMRDGGLDNVSVDVRRGP